MSLNLAFLFLIFTLTLNTHASLIDQKTNPDVIYGTDDRLDIFESSDSLMKNLSKSTAAKVYNDSLTQDGDKYSLTDRTLQDWGGLCSTERFVKQMTAARCSGFLVSPDTIVTAGHCIYSVNDCENHSWIFDYANTTEEREAFTFNKDQVYHCVKIIERQKDNDNMNDYAVLKLDRPVTGRSPLKYRTAGKISDDAVLTVIGHPSGLPVKITSAADLRDNSNPIYFVTNADTYGRNSGSAVVNSRTGLVEGVLVRGDQDFTHSDTASCNVSAKHDINGGRGEDVTRITNIKSLVKKRSNSL
ncbi:MAG: trypsin-like peptidase domain-containing protein [Bacteriovorax sp.]|jgi:V8-like Glu-specific endopeptidase|nr:trypsin-like peptidase domain-containing protein [Bacteriovorax sp.]